MIERPHYDGPISFVCDGCGEAEDMHCTGWAGANAKARSRGWKAIKAGDEWEHLCPPCARSAA